MWFMVDKLEMNLIRSEMALITQAKVKGDMNSLSFTFYKCKLNKIN